MNLSEKTTSKAIYVTSAIIAIIGFCFADFHDSGLAEILIGVPFVIFPAVPLLFLNIKIFRKTAKTTLIIAMLESLILLDLFYEINFGHNNSSTSPVALFFLPLYMLAFNLAVAVIIDVFKRFKK